MYNIGISIDLKLEWLIFLILSRSLLEITGFWIFSFLQCSELIANIFLSSPMAKLISVIISSRIPSSGGLVT